MALMRQTVQQTGIAPKSKPLAEPEPQKEKKSLFPTEEELIILYKLFLEASDRPVLMLAQDE